MDKIWKWLQRSLQCNNIHDQPMWLKKNLVIFRLIREPWPLWWLDSMLYPLSFEFCSSKIMVDEWFTYDTNTCTTEPLLWDTSIQETPQSRGHKIWSPKNVHTMFVFVMSIEGTLPLFRGKGHFFWVLKPGFNFHSGETLAIKLWLTLKVIDKFKCSLVTKVTALKAWINSLKSMYCTCWNSTHGIVDISQSWFLYMI